MVWVKKEGTKTVVHEMMERKGKMLDSGKKGVEPLVWREKEAPTNNKTMTRDLIVSIIKIIIIRYDLKLRGTCIHT